MHFAILVTHSADMLSMARSARLLLIIIQDLSCPFQPNLQSSIRLQFPKMFQSSLLPLHFLHIFPMHVLHFHVYSGSCTNNKYILSVGQSFNFTLFFINQRVNCSWSITFVLMQYAPNFTKAV